MRLIRRSLALAPAVASLVVLTACDKDPARPYGADRTAERLEQLADSLGGEGDLTSVLALLMASDALRAGADLRPITVRVDGNSAEWTGIAMRMSLSEMACEQLLGDLPLMPVTGPDGPESPLEPGEIDLCAPSQFAVAWQGSAPSVARLLTFVGDTGAVGFGIEFGEMFGSDETYGYGMAMLVESADERLWMSDSGRAGAALVADDGACPRDVSRNDFEVELTCRLARYRVELGARFISFGYVGFDPVAPPEEAEVPLVRRRATVAGQSLSGMHLRVERYPDDFPGPRTTLLARAAATRRPGLLAAARLHVTR